MFNFNNSVFMLNNYLKASNIGLGEFTCAKNRITLNYKLD
ncbi:MAG: hypothetical protein ACJAX4_004737 [Clostridium sp.]|jgi:hypothetical protein